MIRKKLINWSKIFYTTKYGPENWRDMSVCTDRKKCLHGQKVFTQTDKQTDRYKTFLGQLFLIFFPPNIIVGSLNMIFKVVQALDIPKMCLVAR